MILKKYIPLMSQDKKSFAFLFNMNELFENFVGKLVPNAKLQNQKIFGNLSLKPDILTESLIIDTKYKKVSSRDDLSTADKYQMFTYGKNFHVKNTMLLYPKHVDDVCEDLVLGKDEDSVNLAMRSLDLEFDGGYEGFVVEMKRRIEEIIW
jgi:5-methylcytosine-specific restriction enzyme subunit McrC